MVMAYKRILILICQIEDHFLLSISLYLKKLKDIFIVHYDKNFVEIIGYKENF